MKMILLLALCFLFSCASSTGSLQNENYNLLNDRSYLLEFPANFDSTKTYDLIMAFHGAYGNGLGMKSLAHFEQLSGNYIVIYPDAKVENWEEGCMCNKPYRLGIDDIGFVNALLDTVFQTYKINQDRVFAVGYSQGGLFVQNVGCKLSERFKAIAVVAAPMSLPLSKNCDPSQSISVLMIHGTADSVLPYLGEDNGSFSLISSPAAIRLWATHNDGLSEPLVSYLDTNQQIKVDDFSANTTVLVKLISINGADHGWSFQGLNTAAMIVDFFDSL